MVPEISHRCPSCGASTRDFGTAALFCPECGSTLAESPEKVEPEIAQAPDAAETLAVTPATVVAEDPAPKVKTVSADNQSKQPVADERHGARERTKETLQRASTMARGAIEDNVKRVQKATHVSTVMLEEATYDPSLRFVLVALALFIVFVILLVLSKVMG